jgi:cell division protein FtsB
MNKINHLSRTTRALLLPLLLAAAFVYFFYHLLTGDRGIWVWYGLSEQVQMLEDQNTVLAARVARMERRVARLKPDTLDLDYVDELARQRLGVAAAGERVLYLPQ